MDRKIWEVQFTLLQARFQYWITMAHTGCLAGMDNMRDFEGNELTLEAKRQVALDTAATFLERLQEWATELERQTV